MSADSESENPPAKSAVISSDHDSRQFGGVVRRISAGLSTFLVVGFVVLLYLLIANASQTAAIVTASRDLDEGYKKAAELFAVKQAADNDAALADFEVGSDQSRQRDDIIANQKRIAALDAFSAHASEFFQIVCFSIIDLRELHYPSRFFISEVGISDCMPAVSTTVAASAGGDAKADTGQEERQRVVPRTGQQNIYMVRQRILAAANVSNFYVLPVLFGCMGGFIFALRELLQNNTRWFEFRTVLGYYLRIALGAICGMVIGYFNIASGSAASANISTSPLLLSLVAGFSVDSVISVLERIALAIRYEKAGALRSEEP